MERADTDRHGLPGMRGLYDPPRERRSRRGVRAVSQYRRMHPGDAAIFSFIECLPIDNRPSPWYRVFTATYGKAYERGGRTHRVVRWASARDTVGGSEETWGVQC